MVDTDVSLTEVPESLAEMFQEKPTEDIEKLSQELIDCRLAIMEHEASVKKLEVQEEALEASLSQQMIAKNLKSIRRKDGILLTSLIAESFYIKGECKENFFVILKKDPNDAGLIKEEMNWKTLQGYMETLLSSVNGKEIPDLQKQKAMSKYAEIKDFLTIQESKKVRITGLKNKLKGAQQ